MTKCHACGLTEGLETAYTKDGKPYLMQVRRIPHLVLCPAKKNEAKPKRAKLVRVKPIVAEAAKMLVEGQKLEPEEAEQLVLGVLVHSAPGEMEDAATLAVAALKRKGEE